MVDSPVELNKQKLEPRNLHEVEDSPDKPTTSGLGSGSAGIQDQVSSRWGLTFWETEAQYQFNVITRLDLVDLGLCCS